LLDELRIEMRFLIIEIEAHPSRLNGPEKTISRNWEVTKLFFESACKEGTGETRKLCGAGVQCNLMKV
jgi:hypothetical protein